VTPGGRMTLFRRPGPDTNIRGPTMAPMLMRIADFAGWWSNGSVLKKESHLDAGITWTSDNRALRSRADIHRHIFTQSEEAANRTADGLLKGHFA
ncbi:MAG: hypothetical protein DMG13_31125, partial [Acidobacteria bacterium]